MQLQGRPAVDVFQRRLASLGRLALSAARQKRAFLRCHAEEGAGAARALGRGFLLERARLVVILIGLDSAVRLLMGSGLMEDAARGELARGILQQLHTALQAEAETAGLDVHLDAASGTLTDWDRSGSEEVMQTMGHTDPAMNSSVAPHWPAASLDAQLHAAAALHETCAGGTAALVLSEHPAPAAEAIMAVLRNIWRDTTLSGLRLVRPAAARQPTIPGFP
jgi:hypothetical protein